MDLMPAARGRTIVLTSGLLGLAVLASAGFAFRARIAEGYWLWKLERGEESDRETAARRLGELRSVRAVPGILKWLASDKTETSGEDAAMGRKGYRQSRSWQNIFAVHASKAVYEVARSAFLSIGQVAVPQLTDLSGEQNGDRPVRFWAKAMLGELKGQPEVVFLKGLGYAIPTERIRVRTWVGQ